MVQYQDTYTPGISRMQDWSTEITPPERRHPAMVGTEPGRKVGEMTGPAGMTGMTGMAGQNRNTAISGPTVVTPPELADMKNNMSMEAINAPSSREEAYLGSWKAMLSRYVGSYVVATFLVGTQNTVAWEGILFDVGNDYITIYQEARDRYIVTDYYSLKFVEFYDVQRRQECNRLLAEQGYGMNSGR